MFFSKKKKLEVRMKTTEERVIDYIWKIFFLIVGAFIVAIALEMFLLPNKIIDGGVIGISMMLLFSNTSIIFCVEEL